MEKGMEYITEAGTRGLSLHVPQIQLSRLKGELKSISIKKIEDFSVERNNNLSNGILNKMLVE
jgi:hypothetical protein